MSRDIFTDIHELNLRNVCAHLSKIGSFIYLWKTPHQKNLTANADAYILFGLDPHPAEFTTDDLEKLIHAEDLEKVRQAEKRLLDKGENEPIEFRIKCPDGTQKYVRQSQALIREGETTLLLNILQDITEQKRADIVLHIMNEAFFDLDNHLALRRANAAAESFTGKTAGELTGKNIWKVFPEAVGTPFYDMINHTHEKKLTERKEIVFPSNGKWIWASMASYPDGMILVFHDMDEQKKTERGLQELNQSLEKKNMELEQKTAELALFSYITSNDLKGPLRKIYTSFEMILTREGSLLSNNAKAHFRRIQSSIQKINLMTDDLLAFTRINQDGESLSETNLEEILHEAKERVEQSSQKKFQVEPDKLPSIKGYPDLLLQLFIHILGNAVKFQNTGQTAIIRIRYELVEMGAPDGSEGSSNKYHKIAFEDNGIGFDNKYADEIFRPFYKLHTQKEFKGTGVGLAICKKIMERHGGFMQAESKGKGASFNCYFPLQSGDSAQKLNLTDLSR